MASTEMDRNKQINQLKKERNKGRGKIFFKRKRKKEKATQLVFYMVHQIMASKDQIFWPNSISSHFNLN